MNPQQQTAPQIQGTGTATNQTLARGNFWIGQDGNVYVADSNGVNMAGKADANTSAWWGGNGYSQINDPNPIPNPTSDLQATGSGGGTTYKDTTASRNATQVSMDSLPTIFNNAVTGAQGKYDAVKAAYDTEDAANLAQYQNDVQKNEITNDENTQAALLSAAKGASGLRATLASLGALGGTGSTLANRAISTEANADLGAGQKSFETNVASLFNTRSKVKKEEDQRRLDASQILKDSIQTAEYNNLDESQKLATEMAGLYSDAGNTTEANKWTNKASSYTPLKAAKTKVNVGTYATDPIAYSTPEMNKYLGGMSSTAVNVAGGNSSPINGALYTSTKKRDELA